MKLGLRCWTALALAAVLCLGVCAPAMAAQAWLDAHGENGGQ